MPLVRAWTRGLSGASGAALLVPGGIIAALLLLALAGSFGRLAGLGQAFSGPTAPGSTSVTSAHATVGRGPGLLPVVSALPAGAAAPTVAGNRVAPTGAGGATPPSATPTPPGRSPSGTGGGAPIAPPTAGGPARAGGCGSCVPPPHQTLIDQVVNLGTSVTSRLPGPVGQLTTQVLKEVGATVDKVLPTDRRPSVTGTVSQVGSTLSQLKPP